MEYLVVILICNWQLGDFHLCMSPNLNNTISPRWHKFSIIGESIKHIMSAWLRIFTSQICMSYKRSIHFDGNHLMKLFNKQVYEDSA